MGRRCEIDLLGRFRVVVDGAEVPAGAWRHRRGADVVKLLALAPGRRMHRERIIDALWPELSPDAGGANLRKAMHFARRALGSEESIASVASMVSLFPDGDVVLDAERFETEARAALRSGDPPAYARAAGLYTGDLLPEDVYEPWVEDLRVRLRALYVEVLKGGRMWERVVEADRTDEDAHRALMLAALETGDRLGVIRTFERLREALRVDLGVGPGSESIALYEKALAMEGHEPPTPAQRARTLIAWGLVHWHTGDLDEAERTAEEARAIAIGASLGREIGDASALLGLVANVRGTWPELFRTEFVRSVRETPEVAGFIFDAHLCLAEFFLSGDQGHEEAAPFARELLDVAEQEGSAQGAALATLMLGEVELLSGRLEAAHTLLSRAAELHERAGASSGQTMAIERLAHAALAEGHRSRVARLLPKAMRLASASRLAPHLIVRIHAVTVEASTDTGSAVAAVRRADRELSLDDVCPSCSIGYRLAATAALARAGRLDAARARLDEADRIAAMWRGGPWLAAVWEARGTIRLAEGQPSQAAALFREAADRFARLKRPLDVQRCQAAAAAAAV